MTEAPKGDDNLPASGSSVKRSPSRVSQWLKRQWDRTPLFLVLAVMILLPVMAAVFVANARDNAVLADDVLVFDTDRTAYGLVESGDLVCRAVALAPSDALPCDASTSDAVVRRDRSDGDIATASDVVALGAGQWVVLEVPAATSPPRGGESGRIVGRVPQADGSASVDVRVEGVALGVRGERVVMAVPATDADVLAPALAAENPTVVAVRALGR